MPLILPILHVLAKCDVKGVWQARLEHRPLHHSIFKPLLSLSSCVTATEAQFLQAFDGAYVKCAHVCCTYA